VRGSRCAYGQKAKEKKCQSKRIDQSGAEAGGRGNKRVRETERERERANECCVLREWSCMRAREGQ
jgi:hypothetical protein